MLRRPAYAESFPAGDTTLAGATAAIRCALIGSLTAAILSAGLIDLGVVFFALAAQVTIGRRAVSRVELDSESSVNALPAAAPALPLFALFPQERPA